MYQAKPYTILSRQIIWPIVLFSRSFLSSWPFSSGCCTNRFWPTQYCLSLNSPRFVSTLHCLFQILQSNFVIKHGRWEAKVEGWGGCKKTTRRHYHQQQWSQRGKLGGRRGKGKRLNAQFHRSKLFCQHYTKKDYYFHDYNVCTVNIIVVKLLGSKAKHPHTRANLLVFIVQAKRHYCQYSSHQTQWRGGTIAILMLIATKWCWLWLGHHLLLLGWFFCCWGWGVGYLLI